MNLEDIVITLDQAKELKELGVKQESLFYWVKNHNDKHYKIYIKNYWHDTLVSNLETLEIAERICIGCDYCDGDAEEIYSAFTLSELLELECDGGKTLDGQAMKIIGMMTYLNEIKKEKELSNAKRD